METSTNFKIGVAILGGFVILLIAGVIIWKYFWVTESFQVPDKILKYNKYHFYDYGFGSPILQADWRQGAFFQPFVPTDQGLYTSNEWAPTNGLSTEYDF